MRRDENEIILERITTKNGQALFADESDMKEYVYSKEDEEYILLAIKFMGGIIGEIHLKNH